MPRRWPPPAALAPPPLPALRPSRQGAAPCLAALRTLVQRSPGPTVLPASRAVDTWVRSGCSLGLAAAGKLCLPQTWPSARYRPCRMPLPPPLPRRRLQSLGAPAPAAAWTCRQALPAAICQTSAGITRMHACSVCPPALLSPNHGASTFMCRVAPAPSSRASLPRWRLRWPPRLPPAPEPTAILARHPRAGRAARTLPLHCRDIGAASACSQETLMYFLWPNCAAACPRPPLSLNPGLDTASRATPSPCKDVSQRRWLAHVPGFRKH